MAAKDYGYVEVEDAEAWLKMMGFAPLPTIKNGYILGNVRVQVMPVHVGCCPLVYTNDARTARYCHSIEQLAYEVGSIQRVADQMAAYSSLYRRSP